MAGARAAALGLAGMRELVPYRRCRRCTKRLV
jgi:hypothetical protein